MPARRGGRSMREMMKAALREKFARRSIAFGDGRAARCGGQDVRKLMKAALREKFAR